MIFTERARVVHVLTAVIFGTLFATEAGIIFVVDVVYRIGVDHRRFFFSEQTAQVFWFCSIPTQNFVIAEVDDVAEPDGRLLDLLQLLLYIEIVVGHALVLIGEFGDLDLVESREFQSLEIERLEEVEIPVAAELVRRNEVLF